MAMVMVMVMVVVMTSVGVLIAWPVCLWDSNGRLCGVGLGRCNSGCNEVWRNTLQDSVDWCSFPVQTLDSCLDVGLNLGCTDNTPVNELWVGAAENLQVPDGFRDPVCGVVLVERDKIYGGCQFESVVLPV